MSMYQSAALPVSSTMTLRLRNVAASAAVVALACTAYWLTPQHGVQLRALFGSTTFSYTGLQFMVAAAVTYTTLLSLYYLVTRDTRPSKSLRCLCVAAAFVRSPRKSIRAGLSREDRLAVLATLLKSFFAPLMVMSLMTFCVAALSNGIGIAALGFSLADFRQRFDENGFWFLMQLIFFIDVLIFTVGYLVEFPWLRNEMRSVDPTLLGWAAALLCYPPFNQVTGTVLGSPLSDFPQFDNPTAHIVLNLLMIALMATYASASVALGFKASNLTHRGIVERGPYRVVRHPAYVCKNMAWWIGSAPLVSEMFARSTFDGIQAIASVVGWSLLYVMRAFTEEDHLRSVDGDYAAYAAKVRYRFIPGLY
jgi:protein-S-isoprenylcysteine O-methyltransferase Ste14